MTSIPLRFRRALALAAALVALAGCAVNHSENFVSLVITQEVAPVDGATAVMTIRPQMANETRGTPLAPIPGGAGVGLQFVIEIRGRGDELLWRGTALERASPSRPDSMQWSDAMADDLALTLLDRLRREGVVRLGANGDAAPT